MEKEFPSRKPLRLKNYDYSAPGAYFITICIQNRKEILSTIVGDGAHDVPRIRLTKTGVIVEKYILSSNKIDGISIDRYVIMPNHIHMITIIHSSQDEDGSMVERGGTSRAPSPTNEKIPHLVSTLKRFCNKEIGENIFQRSYMEHVIRDRRDYEEHVRYIHENPARWREDPFYSEVIL